MNNKGQTLYYFLILVMIVFISWAMMLNIAKLIIDRMKLQNEADNIVLSAAIDKARVMNFVGACNYLIGSLLASGTKPELIQIPAYSAQDIGAYHFGDYDRNKKESAALYKDVKKMKEQVELLQKTQDAALISHLVYQNYLIADAAANKDYYLILTPIALPSKENAQKYFGLKRNKSGIRYLKTINGKFMDVHAVYNPFPVKDMLAQISKALQKSLSAIGFDLEKFVTNIAGKEAMSEKVYAQSSESWYITDENFYKQKITARLIKKERQKDKPLFAKLFGGLSRPPLIAVSAAAIYNTKGTMFPQKESDLLGSSDLSAYSLAATFGEQALFIANLFQKDSTPYRALTVLTGAYLLARIGIAAAKIKEGDKVSPIKLYNEAKNGGWGAHLVPYNKLKNEEKKNIF